MPIFDTLRLHITHHVYVKRFTRLQSALMRAERFPSTGDAKTLRDSFQRAADDLNSVREKLGLRALTATSEQHEGAHTRRVWFRTCAIDGGRQ
jgi:hypothetical protein